VVATDKESARLPQKYVRTGHPSLTRVKVYVMQMNEWPGRKPKRLKTGL
jgi:hypothetical protein